MEYDSIFGIKLYLAYDLDIEKKYQLIKDNTIYLNNINIEDIKDIKFSIWKDIIVLLNDGTLFKNGKKIDKNIKHIIFIDGMSTFSCDKDNVLKCITLSNTTTEFINYNNYKYKKILISPLHIVALTYDNIVRCYGTFASIIIDYNKYFDIEDIGYVKENEDVVVIKNGNVYSLFGNIDYTTYNPDIVIEGKEDDIMII